MLKKTLKLIQKLNTADLLTTISTSPLKDSLLITQWSSFFFWKTIFYISWIIMFTLHRSEDSDHVHAIVSKECMATRSYRNCPILTVGPGWWAAFGQISDFSFSIESPFQTFFTLKYGKFITFNLHICEKVQICFSLKTVLHYVVILNKCPPFSLKLSALKI